LPLNFGPLSSGLGPQIFDLGREVVAVCGYRVEGRGVFVSDEVDNGGQVTGRERLRCAARDGLTGVCSGVRYVEYGRVRDKHGRAGVNDHESAGVGELSGPSWAHSEYSGGG
jgi:hypothetical protein